MQAHSSLRVLFGIRFLDENLCQYCNLYGYTLLHTVSRKDFPLLHLHIPIFVSRTPKNIYEYTCSTIRLCNSPMYAQTSGATNTYIHMRIPVLVVGRTRSKFSACSHPWPDPYRNDAFVSFHPLLTW